MEQCLAEWRCDKIFLASDERAWRQAFREHFGERCFMLPRNFRGEFQEADLEDYAAKPYDGDYTKSYCYEVAKAYLAEMALLSTCNSVVLHRCSGSVGVMMMATGLEHVLAFNLGEYGMPSEKDPRLQQEILWSRQD